MRVEESLKEVERRESQGQKRKVSVWETSGLKDKMLKKEGRFF